ncbi:MAG: GNAT family N-acetyltransferase [Candidatus Bipolaricaulis sp.]|nr:GNAT family N-acetyltransferase [Candidatus Bipolaricaulis sp.]
MSLERSSAFTLRPAQPSDAELLTAMFNADSERILGVRQHDVDNLLTEWRAPGFDLERDTRVLVDPSGNPAGYAEVWDIDPPHVRIWAWGCVDPVHRGRGVGSDLVAWQEERGRAALAQAPVGSRVILRQTVSTRDESGLELLASAGYAAIRRNYRMRIDLNGSVPEPVWPSGVALRTFHADQDLVPMVEAIRSAFRDHWGYVESPLDSDVADWRHVITEEKSFDAGLWFLATAGGDIVGVSLCSAMEPEDPDLAYVNTLGVVQTWRRRGIALALLHHSFRELGGRGKRRVALGVDGSSLTGAVRVYERAGMHVDRERVLFEKELRRGRDLTTQRLEGWDEAPAA